MRIGMIGMGKMGGSMVERLRRGAHEVVAFDTDRANLQKAAGAGAEPAESLALLAQALQPPRAVWIMVPHGAPTSETIAGLLEHLAPDDVLLDGGNSHYTDSIAAAERCRERQIHFLDVGVSGGVWGLREGYCLMVGGPKAAFDRLEPVFRTLAPSEGYALVGPNGAGHFVKMVHNAIEYGMLQALGEGFECLHRSPYTLDLGAIARLWQHGSVVRSWLLDLVTRTFARQGNALAGVEPFVEDSGTGRWSVEYALQNALPLPAITQALYQRFASRQDERFADKVIAALRHEFGGHRVVTGRSP